MSQGNQEKRVFLPDWVQPIIAVTGLGIDQWPKCLQGYAKKVRAVPVWLKRQAYAENGITQYKTGDCEVDHLIPLSLDALIPFVTFGPRGGIGQ
jgi:hypothetical protein